MVTKGTEVGVSAAVRGYHNRERGVNEQQNTRAGRALFAWMQHYGADAGARAGVGVREGLDAPRASTENRAVYTPGSSADVFAIMPTDHGSSGVTTRGMLAPAVVMRAQGVPVDDTTTDA